MVATSSFSPAPSPHRALPLPCSLRAAFPSSAGRASQQQGAAAGCCVQEGWPLMAPWAQLSPSPLLFYSNKMFILCYFTLIYYFNNLYFLFFSLYM
jgi:hypothetical protein